MIDGMLRGFGLHTRQQRLAALFAVILFFGLAAVFGPRTPAANSAPTVAASLEETVVDMCRTAIGFEHPRAEPGYSKVSRSLPDGSHLVRMPFTVGKASRMARCVGKGDTFEFSVERG